MIQKDVKDVRKEHWEWENSWSIENLSSIFKCLWLKVQNWRYLHIFTELCAMSRKFEMQSREGLESEFTVSVQPR